MKQFKFFFTLTLLLFFSITLSAETLKVVVKIKPPRNCGLAPVTGYFIEKREIGTERWIRIMPNWSLIPFPKSTYTISDGLKPVEYEFRAIAVNKYGESAPSHSDYADLRNETYWEVYLVCNDFYQFNASKNSTSSTFQMPNFSQQTNTIKIPLRSKE